MANMELPPVLKRVVDWLRAGYPEGVPDVDYLPLFALLGSELTNHDVELIAEELELSSNPQSSEADVNRVRARLAGAGWPLAKPHHL
jgi:hypothetical protein